MGGGLVEVHESWFKHHPIAEKKSMATYKCFQMLAGMQFMFMAQVLVVSIKGIYLAKKN